MGISRAAIADTLKKFICSEYHVSDEDPSFTKEAHLFELGFVDSVGFVELLSFIETRFGIELDGERIFMENVTSIEGITEVVWSLLTGEIDSSGYVS